MQGGIARAAHSGTTLELKRRVEYRDLASVRLLNRCTSERAPFEWTINPYRGCEFGCKYCYARYTHEFMEYRDPSSFEQLIFSKSWNAAGFRRELRSVKPEHWIALGTATDPYQPAERRFGMTRRVLETFQSLSGFNLGITTKSDLVARDSDLLARISKRNNIRVTLTITTADTELARLLEPMAPRPQLRFEAVHRLAEAGVRCGVTVSPVMPGINDSRASFAAIAQAARDAGAHYFMGHVVFLQPCATAVFFPFLDQHFPALAAAYRRHFRKSAFIRGEYPERIQERIREVRKDFGLESSNHWQPIVEQGSLDFGAPPEQSSFPIVRSCAC
jgi:DNA repair photolyase